MKESAAQPKTARARLLNCPANQPFLKSLAGAVLSGSIWENGAPANGDLPGITIYVPTRAAVDPLKLAFLERAPNGATFLPRIRVLGDVDPLELFATFPTRTAFAQRALDLLKDAIEVAPAFSKIERQLQLAALILKASQTLQSTRLEPGERVFTTIAPAGAFTIAHQIASLIDEAQSEGADLELIERLDLSTSSGSEQLSLQLLRAVLKGWRAHKAGKAKIDGQERSNQLMAIEAEFIRLSDAPVIIAGSTGSLAPTLHLMEAALTRPNNAIVLAGLDRHLDAESWTALNGHPEHAQYGLQQLLTRLGIAREQVAELAPASSANSTRAKFLSEALRPAATTARWQYFLQEARSGGDPAVTGLSIIEADTIQDEADTIALILRESLEMPGRTAALITRDSTLSNRVRHSLARWNIASEPPPENAERFVVRVAACAASGKPEDFIALLRHAPSDKTHNLRRLAELMDLGALRQMWRPATLAGLSVALARAQHAIAAGESRHPAMKGIGQDEWEAARAFTVQSLDALQPMLAMGDEPQTFANWLSAHRQVLSNLAELGLGGAAPLPLLEDLARFAPSGFPLQLADYSALFAEAANKPDAHGKHPHPRLFFWTPLDARLLSADVLILAGLNEGSWPQAAEPDPWLNRRDRTFVGLSAPERRTGQAAQDFAALAANAPQVYLTRSRKSNGSLARPSRWLSRIKTLAAGAGQSHLLQSEKPWLASACAHREPERVRPMDRPEPKPPVAVRPRRLSVTAIETWFANPYAIYARHILGLEPLRRLDERADARDKGILYHAALHRFFESFPAELPQDIASRLCRELDRAAEELGFQLENAPFWRPRFARFADWFAETEGARRVDMQRLKSEVGGKLALASDAGAFEITARADRIDLMADGAVRIYDFKTSANTAKVSVARNAPQLALEGLLAREGAFGGISAGAKVELAYIVATGGEPPGEIVAVKVPSAEAIQSALTGVTKQIAKFDLPETPYAYETRAVYKDKSENDPYAHLARVQEWSVEEAAEEDDD